MKPVTHHIKLFTVERVPGIRMSRELALAEGRDTKIKKRRAKGTSKRKTKRIELSAKSQASLESMTPELRAFLEASM